VSLPTDNGGRTQQPADLLFAVAKADGEVSNEELLEITYLAEYPLIRLDRVNEAFLKVAH